MAKVGEGDPRWIVADRADGKNVNSWHWTEKDVSEWAKSRVTSLFENQTIIDTTSLRCKTTSVTNCEGECTVYNRKGKITFLLELKFTVNWEAELLGSTGDSIGSCKGKMTVPDLEHDTNPEKMHIEVSGSGEEEGRFLHLMQTEGRAWTRSKTSAFLKELKDGHGVQEKKASVETNINKKGTAPSKVDDGSKSDFSCTLEWRAAPSNIWEALTNEGRVSAYTRSTAKVKAEPEGDFQFLNGTISGKFVEVVPLKKLVMSWRLSDWAEGHSSVATITLDSVESGSTTLKLVHIGIPGNDLERTKQGWQQNFWDPIKMLFGYGYDLK
eukprot:GGOE01063200.1.p1 GENE.GGOE01063200.1~~GGOE01063200.1.p1  ORF type:complete len:326 (-),score=63.22 GGOE01063200.1:352-1329(-)